MQAHPTLRLNRPLVALDTETTGTVPFRDRIVEIAMLKLHPDGRREEWNRRIDPEMRIPIEATAIHGITNADVEDSPPFRRIAAEIVQWIGDADLCGFNIHGFDLRILQAEFARCGEPFPLEGRRVIDAQVIFHKREPRDLSAAVAFYLGRRHEGAHGALADARATLEVLQAQLGRSPDLPPTADGLAEVSRRSSSRYVDPDRKLEWRDGEACITFGKHAGRRLRELIQSDPDYIGWILNSDFPDPFKAILREALEGRFPAPEPEENE
ncbi:MAG: 3'-5' exonuclease [Candidatus Eisenbacteria bacterium]|nr:3'-5' exonuclease [Candidatus Latescibacterota bacterium]MBD3302032.1 3'-5' exonuclease [Candidatus Eisenbacteria bacterium]